MTATAAEDEIAVCQFDDLADPGSREFRFDDDRERGFVVRRGDEVYAYRNHCMHVGYPLNWKPHEFLTRDGRHIICAAHGAIYQIDSGVCTEGPCPGKRLRAYRATVRNGTVFVSIPASD